MVQDWPPLLSFLHEELGYAVHRAKPVLGYELYFIDFSSWKLRLSSRTPVILVKAGDLAGVSPQHLMQSLLDVMRERNLARQIVLVLVDGPAKRLRGQKAGPLYSLVHIGADEQASILCSRRPSGELLMRPGRRSWEAGSSDATTRYPGS